MLEISAEEPVRGIKDMREKACGNVPWIPSTAPFSLSPVASHVLSKMCTLVSSHQSSKRNEELFSTKEIDESTDELKCGYKLFSVSESITVSFNFNIWIVCMLILYGDMTVG